MLLLSCDSEFVQKGSLRCELKLFELKTYGLVGIPPPALFLDHTLWDRSVPWHTIIHSVVRAQIQLKDSLLSLSVYGHLKIQTYAATKTNFVSYEFLRQSLKTIISISPFIYPPD